MIGTNKRTNLILPVVFFLTLIIALALVIFFGSRYGSNGLLLGGETHLFTEGWQTANGASIRLPGTVNGDDSSSIILRNTLPAVLPDGTVLYICSTYQSAEVFVDGVSVYSWSLENTALFKRPFGLPCYIINIPASSASKTIELHLQSNVKGENIPIYTVMLGDAVRTTISLIEQQIDTVVLFFLLTTLVVMLVALVLLFRKQMTRYSKDAAILSIFIALSATWMINDSPLSLLFTKNLVTTVYASLLSQMLMPVPMVLFMRRFVHRGRKLLNVVATLVLLNFFVCVGLLFFGVADLIQTLFTTHILELVSCVVIIVLCISEYVTFKRRDVVEVLTGYCLLCLFGITSIIIFSINGDPSSSMFVRIGLTAFILTLGFSIIRRGIAELARSKSYRNITLSIPSGICRLSDFESSGIVYANAFYYMMFGYTEAGARTAGFTSADFSVLPADLPAIKETIANSVAAGLGTFETEARHQKKNGEIIWILSRFTIDPKDKGVITAVMIEITDRKRTEEQLRISEEEYRIATRHSNKLIIRLDVRTRTTYRQSDIPSPFGLPNIVANVPESIIDSGFIAEDSVDTIRGFYDAIYNGAREGSAVVSMFDMTAGDHKWFHFDFTSIFDDCHKPVQAIISYYDVTLQRQKELAFQRWQQSYNAIPKNATNYYEYNLTADLLEHTEGAMLPAAPDEVHRNLADIATYIAKHHIYREDIKGWLEFMNRDRLLEIYADGIHTDKTEFRRLNENTPLWTSINIQLIPDPYSSDVKGYILLEDIDERKKAELYLRERSTLDALTGLLNRITFVEKFEDILCKSNLETQHALIMLDIDNFKTINDTLGHNAGDALLVNISSKLKYALRAEDLCGRLGGDEFVICLKNMNLGKPLETRVNDLCNLICDEQAFGVSVSASFGIAGFPYDGRTFDELYQKADIALYKAKAKGRGGFAVYDPQLSFDDISVNRHT